jgi:serine protease
MHSLTSSSTGAAVANSFVIPAGFGGALQIVSQDADFLLDIHGYFVPADDPAGLTYYPVKPCRVFEGEFSAVESTRPIPVAGERCGVPAGAAAYALNFTVRPKGSLGFLTAWATGDERPDTSVLNAHEGYPVANSAIVAAGAGGSIDLYAALAEGATSEAAVDVYGYFAQPGAGGLSYYLRILGQSDQRFLPESDH